jgi:hypothetical protein|tara:strand:+ start:232 stop:555 length:324 start_codon:yes stop_codon:yes gene_type:complete
MAGIKSFVKQIDPQNKSVTQTQSNVNTALKQIANSAIIDGVLIKGVNVGTADTIVNHKLGREPLGWIVIKKNEAGEIYESSTVNKNRDKFLILKGSTATTDTNFWIF